MIIQLYWPTQSSTMKACPVLGISFPETVLERISHCPQNNFPLVLLARICVKKKKMTAVKYINYADPLVSRVERLRCFHFRLVPNL